MFYRLNVNTGCIHTTCKHGIQKGEKHYKEYKTLREAEIQAKFLKKPPHLCRHSKFREELQREIDL